MKPYRHVKLEPESYLMLNEGHHNSPKSHFRLRCHALLLSHDGYRIEAISKILKKRPETIRDWMTDWETQGLVGLMIKKGRGRKPSLRLNDTPAVDLIKKK